MSCTQDIETGREPSAGRGLERWRFGMLELDRSAVALARVSDRLSVPLARVCHEITSREHWRRSGMRWADFGREYGFGARWIAELGFLGGKLDALTGLERALREGRLCRSAAVGIARVATAESVGAWLEVAASQNIRQLKQQLKRARQAGSAFPVPDGEAAVEPEPSVAADDEDAPKWVVREVAPLPVWVAFDECRDLFEAVNGHESGTVAFVEALLAEGDAGPDTYECAALSPLHTQPETDTAAADRLDAGGRWRELDLEPSPPDALRMSRELLQKVESLGEVCVPLEDDAEARGLFLQLVSAERDARRVLGEVLHALMQGRPFGRRGPCLPYVDLGHYAEARLGISRSLAYMLAHVARRVLLFPRIRAGYEAGAIPVHGAALALRVLDGHPDGGELDEVWAERLSCSTFKRVRDETAHLRRARVLDRDVLPAPLEDATWVGSTRREPGTTVKRLAHLARQACHGRNEPETVRLVLPQDLALRFHGACAARDERLKRQLEQLGNQDAPFQAFSDFPLLAVQTFSRFHGGSIDGWGLFALLWEFATTWDPPPHGARSPSEEIYQRRGYRCAAPACTARVVEDSHTEARGRGGSDEPENRDADCPYHHRQGIHGSLARRIGKAPLNTIWRLGVGAWTQWYRNELRVPDPGPVLLT